MVSYLQIFFYLLERFMLTIQINLGLVIPVHLKSIRFSHCLVPASQCSHTNILMVWKEKMWTLWVTDKRTTYLLSDWELSLVSFIQTERRILKFFHLVFSWCSPSMWHLVIERWAWTPHCNVLWSHVRVKSRQLERSFVAGISLFTHLPASSDVVEAFFPLWF